VDPRAIYQRMKGVGSLQNIQAAALQELCAWREQIAFEHNLPPRTVLKDAVMMELATRMPRKPDDLARIRGLAPAESATYGSEIVAAVSRARQVPPAQRPALPVPVEDTLETKRLAETLWVAAQAICLGRAVTPALVTAQTQIIALARLLTAGEPLEQHPLMRGWRSACLGQPLLDFLYGKTELCVRMDGQGLALDMR